MPRRRFAGLDSKGSYRASNTGSQGLAVRTYASSGIARLQRKQLGLKHMSNLEHLERY